jgi:hypothetical protein
MLDFIQSNLVFILSAIIVIAVLLVAYKAGNKKTLKKIILSLVVQAEKELGSKTGEIKYAMVVERVYQLIPSILRVLITKKELDNMIEDAVLYLKVYLTEDRNLLGYEEEYKKVIYDNSIL